MLEKLLEWRTKAGYSTRHISRKLNISKTYYWQIEKAQRRLPYETAVKIAKIFDLKPDDLFYEDYKVILKY